MGRRAIGRNGKGRLGSVAATVPLRPESGSIEDQDEGPDIPGPIAQSPFELSFGRGNALGQARMATAFFGGSSTAASFPSC
jgi:hypothetical protein